MTLQPLTNKTGDEKTPCCGYLFQAHWDTSYGPVIQADYFRQCAGCGADLRVLLDSAGEYTLKQEPTS